MSVKYLSTEGDIIDKTELSISKAKEIVSTIEKLPYYLHLECRRSTDKSEAVIFDTEVETGQKINNDIRKTERIAIIFTPDDNYAPEVLALREDFPIVPHLNLREQEKPRSLCIFEEKYSELKLRWNPTLFLESIRGWLSLTAKGELHAEDQTLEPLIIGYPLTLILPFNISEHFKEQKGKNDFEHLIIRKREYGESGITFIAERIEDIRKVNSKEIEFISSAIQGKPQPHGIIHKQPLNLYELIEFPVHRALFFYFYLPLE